MTFPRINAFPAISSRRCSLILCALALSTAFTFLPARAKAQADQPARQVALELALLVDVSASVNDEEYRLQMNGLATALADAAVREALRTSARGGAAISVIQWADGENQRISVDWTPVHNDADALAFAADIASAPRLIHGGHTALGSAVDFAIRELDSNLFAGSRRVIDLSGDGRTNDGYPLRAAREEAIAKGITINGLAILNELPLLYQYYRDYLIAGEGAFFMIAQDYVDFADAMIEKLVREISAVPLSNYDGPASPEKAQERTRIAAEAGN